MDNSRFHQLKLLVVAAGIAAIAAAVYANSASASHSFEIGVASGSPPAILQGTG